MPEQPGQRRRLRRPWERFPSQRDWERSVVLDAHAAPRDPEWVSDGAGLTFALTALEAPAAPLDPDDPAIAALAASVSRRPRPALAGWRALARTEDEALFGLGRPPGLTTVAVRREGRRGGWNVIATTRDPTLRRTRDGVRASGWELDETHPLQPGDTIVRMLVTEQTRSGGAFADGRLLAPDVHLDDTEVRIAIFVTPLTGIIPAATRTPRTPVRLRLPEAIGTRTLFDASVWDPDD